MNITWSHRRWLVISILIAAASVASNVFTIYSYNYHFSNRQLDIMGGISILLGYIAAAIFLDWLLIGRKPEIINRKKSVTVLFLLLAILAYAVGFSTTFLPFGERFVNTWYQVQVIALELSTGVLAVAMISFIRSRWVGALSALGIIWFWHEVVWALFGSWTPYSLFAWSGNFDWLVPQWSLILGLLILVANAVFVAEKHEDIPQGI